MISKTMDHVTRRAHSYIELTEKGTYDVGGGGGGGDKTAHDFVTSVFYFLR